jgi:hypothetical protein
MSWVKKHIALVISSAVAIPIVVFVIYAWSIAKFG